MRTPAAVLLLAAAFLAQTPTAEQTAARLERRLQSLRSFRADFVQTYRSASLASPLKESGRVFFQRPGSMRWEYLEPEAKVFLYKDGVFEQYYAEDNQLIRSRISAEDSGAEVLSILTGARKLSQGYAIDFLTRPSDTGNVLRLKLTPLSEGEYSHILLDVRASDGLLARAVFTDFGGNTTEFEFKRPRPDIRLPAGTFELKVPPDCEVIDDLPPSPPEKRDG